MINQSFTPVKAPIYRQATDQKVRGSNPCGRTTGLSRLQFYKKIPFRINHDESFLEGFSMILYANIESKIDTNAEIK
jgi:hypothetical protein